ITALVERAGFVPVALWNYGFPLANMMRPLMNLYHRLRHKTGKGDAVYATGETGLQYRHPLMQLLAGFCNEMTLWPFLRLQMLFRYTSLGNGYLLLARLPS